MEIILFYEKMKNEWLMNKHPKGAMLLLNCNFHKAF